MRTFQTTDFSGSINNLNACQSYWVEVTVLDCDIQLRSLPRLIGVHQSMTFKVVISIEDSAPCMTWIADNVARKLSDVQSIITSELQDCGISASCVANDQFACEENQEITYE